MKAYALSFVIGALAILGFAPFGWYPLPILALAGLFHSWRNASARQAALHGFVWGMGLFLVGVSWVYVSMHDVGGLAMPLAALAALLFCAVLAVFPALAGWLSVRFGGGLRSRFGATEHSSQAILWVGAWSLSEYARGMVLTGFPWLALGYAQAPPSPLAGFAPLIGATGLSLISAALAAWLVFGQRRWLALIGCLVVFAVGWGLRQVEWTQATDQPLKVALLQGDVPQQLKWDVRQLQLSFTTYRQLAAQASQAAPDLIVLPETALPLFLERIPRSLLVELAHGVALISGVVTHNRQGDYFNSAVLTNSSGEVVGSYNKRHLVPYGEYAPPGFAWFFDWVNIPMAAFVSGANAQAPLAVGAQSIAVNICYEDIFSALIRSDLPQATLLLNLSNTAWFGHSLAQPQQLQIAQLRALETGRPMLRATNTGMTALILADGVIAAQLPPFTRDLLVVRVSGRSGATPYVRLGDTPVLAMALLMLLWGLGRGQSAKRGRT